MHTFPHLMNGPIDEQQLLKLSEQLIEEGLPEDATPGLIRRFNVLQRRHETLLVLVNAYEDNQRSMFTCLLAGRYYSNLERAIGSYRSALILTQIA